MPNHYHLFLETIEPSLSSATRHLNSVYTVASPWLTTSTFPYYTERNARAGSGQVPSVMQLATRFLRRVEFWGLLLRLLLMPIACHYDLLSYYWAAHEVVFHHRSPFEGHLMGQLYFCFPTAYLNVAWLWLIKPLLGPGDPWSHDWFPGGDVYATNVTAWRALVSLPHIGLMLFLLKLPHLIGEWGMIRLLGAIPKAPRQRQRLVRFLWLNPVSIFVLYVYGSVEIFTLVLLALGLWCVSRQRRVLAALALGLSAPFRFFPALFFVPFAWIMERRWGRRLSLLGAIGLPFGFWLTVMVMRHPGTLSFLANYPSMNFLLSLKIPVHDQDVLYPFVIGYVLVAASGIARRGDPLERLLDVMLGTLLVFYATSFFHPQYFIWMIPMMALRVAARPELLPVFWVQVACYAVYTVQWGRPLAGYLFAPLNPQVFMALRSPSELLAPLGSAEKLVGLVHSVLASASLWMTYRILKPARETL